MLSPNRQLAALGAVISVAVLAIYWPAVSGDFSNWDDSRFIYKNPLFAGSVLDYIAAAVSRIQFEAYQPLHLLSYVPDRLLWPEWAGGFRLINCALFVACTLTLFAIVRRHASARAGALACLLFAVHPLCVEPVAWITSRKDLLSLLLLLVAFRLEDEAELSKRRHIIAITVYVAALLTKTATAVFAPALVFWLVWARGCTWRTAALRSAPLLLAATAALLGTTLLWRQHGLIIERPDVPIALDIAATYGFYLSRILAPIELAALYPRVPGGFPLFAIPFVSCAVVTLALWRRIPALARFSLAAMVIALAPVSNALPLMFRFADRYAFIALALSTFAVAALADWVSQRWRSGAQAMVLIVLANAVPMTVASFHQAHSWHSSEALWRDVVNDQPKAYLGHLKLAETLRDGGDYDEAAEHYRKAIELDGDRPLAYAGLIYLYAKQREDAGQLERGTADRWLGVLGAAMHTPGQLTSLRNESLSAGCRRCALTIELVRLKIEPESDETLLDKADAALGEAMNDFAAVYLNAVRDQRSERYRKLSGALTAP